MQDQAKFDTTGLIGIMIRDLAQLRVVTDQIKEVWENNVNTERQKLRDIEEILREKRHILTAMIDRVGCAKLMMADLERR